MSTSKYRPRGYTMVKISGFASVNPEEKPQEGISPTLEAEEVAVIEEYERGIHLAVDCEHAAAEVSCLSFNRKFTGKSSWG